LSSRTDLATSWSPGRPQCRDIDRATTPAAPNVTSATSGESAVRLYLSSFMASAYLVRLIRGQTSLSPLRCGHTEGVTGQRLICFGCGSADHGSATAERHSPNFVVVVLPPVGGGVPGGAGVGVAGQTRARRVLDVVVPPGTDVLEAARTSLSVLHTGGVAVPFDPLVLGALAQPSGVVASGVPHPAVAVLLPQLLGATRRVAIAAAGLHPPLRSAFCVLRSAVRSASTAAGAT